MEPGDNPSGDTYQVGELVVSGSLPLAHDICIPPGPAGVPVNNLSYSDDRCLVQPTLPALVDLTRQCTRAPPSPKQASSTWTSCASSPSRSATPTWSSSQPPYRTISPRPPGTAPKSSVSPSPTP